MCFTHECIHSASHTNAYMCLCGGGGGMNECVTCVSHTRGVG